MARKGGSLSATSHGRGQSFAVDVRVIGADKASDEFKHIRRTINGQLRAAMVKAGERSVLPEIKASLPDRWSAGLFVKRDRAGVFIGSRLRGSMNRALGWYDFGGRRSRDTVRREGPHAIVGGLQRERPAIDNAIQHALEEAFSAFDTRF